MLLYSDNCSECFTLPSLYRRRRKISKKAVFVVLSVYYVFQQILEICQNGILAAVVLQNQTVLKKGHLIRRKCMCQFPALSVTSFYPLKKNLLKLHFGGGL